MQIFRKLGRGEVYPFTLSCTFPFFSGMYGGRAGKQGDQYKAYAETVHHANIRIAILGQVRARAVMPHVGRPFVPLMRKLFLRWVPKVLSSVAEKLRKFPRKETVNSMWHSEAIDYPSAKKQLEDLRSELLAQQGEGEGPSRAVSGSYVLASSAGKGGTGTSKGLSPVKRQRPVLATAKPAAAPVAIDLTGCSQDDAPAEPKRAKVIPESSSKGKGKQPVAVRKPTEVIELD